MSKIYLLCLILICTSLTAAEFSFAGEWQLTEDPSDTSNLCNVFFATKDIGIAVGEGTPKIIYSTDGGNTWNDAKADIDLNNYMLHGVCMIDSKIGWVSGQMHPGGRGRAILLKTEDAGKTWKKQQIPDDIESANKVYFADEDNGWIIPYGGVIWRTDDGGNTWKSINPNVHFFHPGFFAFDKDNIILVGSEGLILRSKDAGKSWKVSQVKSMQNKPNEHLTSVYFINDRYGWVCGTDGEIALTEDGGITWNEIDSGVKNYLSDIAFIDSSEGWITGCALYKQSAFAEKNGVLLHTLDGGRTWKDESPVTSTLRSIFFLDKNHGWAVGGAGGSASEPKVMILIYTTE